MQAQLLIDTLPHSSFEASRLFHAHYTGQVTEKLAEGGVTALVIVMPVAGPDHDDWRRTCARDLARACTPKRVNLVGAPEGEGREKIVQYLKDAPGVTGQYLVAHG